MVGYKLFTFDIALFLWYHAIHAGVVRPHIPLQVRWLKTPPPDTRLDAPPSLVVVPSPSPSLNHPSTTQSQVSIECRDLSVAPIVVKFDERVTCTDSVITRTLWHDKFLNCAKVVYKSAY